MARMCQMSGWGNYPVIIEKEDSPQFIRDIDIEKNLVHPRAYGRSYGDASLPGTNHVSLNTRFLNRFIHFDKENQILEVESGVSLEEIIRYFLPKGYFLPVTPGTKFVSIGGALASNVHGKNHHHHGAIENFVEEMNVSTPVGRIACSREKHADLFRATISGYGLTGIIESAKIRLKSVETSWIKTRKIQAKNLEEVFLRFEEYKASEYSVAWLDTLATGRHMGRSILFVGEHAKKDELPATFSPFLIPRSRKTEIPFFCPQFFLHHSFLRFFNSLFYRKGQDQMEQFENYDSYFYPLDSLHHWNRMYGRRGFLQYQFCIPDPYGIEGVTACLDFLSRKKMGSFLSILKRCGDDYPFLAFGKKGFSLALDIPIRRDTLDLLTLLDKIVIKYHGCVYLTKDARLSADALREMYPHYTNWRNVCSKYNPEKKCWSRMAQRLGL